MSTPPGLVLPSGAMPWGRWLQDSALNTDAKIEATRADVNSAGSQFAARANMLSNQLVSLAEVSEALRQNTQDLQSNSDQLASNSSRISTNTTRITNLSEGVSDMAFMKTVEPANFSRTLASSTAERVAASNTWTFTPPRASGTYSATAIVNFTVTRSGGSAFDMGLPVARVDGRIYRLWGGLHMAQNTGTSSVIRYSGAVSIDRVPGPMEIQFGVITAPITGITFDFSVNRIRVVYLGG